MRHGKKHNHLKRKTGHRKALFRNLSIALIEHKRIKTTLAKAKALRVFLEPLVTKSKVNSTHNRRVVFSYLGNKHAVTELFSTVSEAVADRPGGYLRIIKTGYRLSDSAQMAIIEFVDFNTVYTNGTSKSASGEGKKKKTRRRGGKKSSTAAAAAATVATAKETFKDEVESAKSKSDSSEEE